MTYPFNDDDMTYDYKTHRYALTPECVLSESGVNLVLRLNTAGATDATTAVNYALKEVSAKLYGFIYSHNPRFKMWLEYILAKYPPARERLKEWLLNEIAYSLKNGDFFNYAGINVAKSSAMDLSTLRDNRVVSLLTEQGINEPFENGIVLGYQGFYPVPPNIKYREDY